MPLTATARDTWGAVELDVDLSSTSNPWLIQITRTNNATGEAAVVRSGDMIVSPGGYLRAYDMEAPLGTSLTYSAQAYTYLEVATGSPATATVTSPDLALNLAWVKAIDSPELSRAIKVAADVLPQKRKQSRFDVIGRPNPVVHSYGLGGREGTLNIFADDWDDIDAIGDLVAEDRLLVQFSPSLHIPDLFCAVGDIAPNVMGGRQIHLQTWRIGVVEIDRPSTVDSPLRVPGVSWASQAAVFSSYTAAAADLTSWSDYASQDGATPLPPVTGDVVGVDNGDGTITWSGTDVIDNGDGTYTLNGVTAYGPGEFTV